MRRKRFHAPQWVWLLAVVAVVAAVVAVVVSAGGKNDKASTSATTEAEATTAETEATEPPVTHTVAPTTTTKATSTTEATEATEVPTTPATTPTGSDEVAGSPAGVVGDRANPVPAGTIADIGSGWRLQVLNVNPDAAAAIAAENEFNEPPPPGSTLSLITVALGYFGLEDPKSAFETTISAVGAGNVELPAECGVVPQQLDSFGEVFAGGVVLGNVCFVTTPQDAGTLELYATGGLFSDEKVFLDAAASPASVVPMASLAGPQPGATATPSRLSPTSLGTAADVGDGWKLTVSSAASDITDSLMAENQFNSPPPDGFRFIGVGVTYSYDGAGSASAYNVNTKAVGASNLALSNNCGFFSTEIDLSADIFSGGSVTGTICFVVPVSSPGLVLYATATFDAKNVMFATS